MSPLRLGILGAARIAPHAIVEPARTTGLVEVAAVAARSKDRAEEFAALHEIGRVHGSYAELVDDPELDAIYVALPNALHAEWTIRALTAGKHVLCEKPVASNAREAESMAEAASRHGRVLGEAFHYRYHPFMERALAIVRAGDLGRITHAEAVFTIPFAVEDARKDIRFDLGLAGGATMDLGCYTISMVRHVFGSEPVVRAAKAIEGRPEIDVEMRAELAFEGGGLGTITCAMGEDRLYVSSLAVTGERGRLTASNPIFPHLMNLLEVETDSGSTTETIPTGESTYAHQLRAFVAAIRDGRPMPTDGQDGVRNMAVIDAVYRTAGLSLRGAPAAVCIDS